ncbi:hypothetical protein [Ureibacillus acetophenoni]|uniref:Uncharacterized protein n=1 Tax=Ureibacillus acetophenoni TaxID=614649 RepID=A0A285U5Z7_9BACL|nr:hypothetical protein [Ureibacillus acetophenoni]SOC37107.1 hypothetical protein SAMN05877842_10338 [Ureibacillus acetophenoni]
MNKYLTLSILVIIISFFYLIFENPQAINLQEISLIDDQISEYPLDDNGNDINATIALVTITLIITSSIRLFSLFSIFTRRLMLITTIFYQSNYLINSFE